MNSIKTKIKALSLVISLRNPVQREAHQPQHRLIVCSGTLLQCISHTRERLMLKQTANVQPTLPFKQYWVNNTDKFLWKRKFTLVSPSKRKKTSQTGFILKHGKLKETYPQSLQQVCFPPIILAFFKNALFPVWTGPVLSLYLLCFPYISA